MRLILFDVYSRPRKGFYPLSLSRPIWELRCGITTLGEKLIAAARAGDVAYFLPPYMAAAWCERTGLDVNDPAGLAGDDLLLVDARLKPDAVAAALSGPSRVVLDDNGDVLLARICGHDALRHGCGDIESLLDWARTNLPISQDDRPSWRYVWELMLANPAQITADFQALARRGVEGQLSDRACVMGSDKDLYLAAGAVVGPEVVIDTTTGPVYIDRAARIEPFSHICGPCYIGAETIVYGARLRPGNSIGPVCRLGGEVADTIIQGYTNKYHDGFLGHAYVGEWVNLGAGTTNSDLKSDYSYVSVCLDGRNKVDTGSLKVGSLIGDHAKTSIGTLLNTGAYVGAMSMILAAGTLVPKFIPSFGFVHKGKITEAFGRDRLYAAAAAMMKRRAKQWSDAQQAMWDAVYELTASPRGAAVKRTS